MHHLHRRCRPPTPPFVPPDPPPLYRIPPFPKDASEGAKAFVKLMRAYMVTKPRANLLDPNATTKVIRDAVKAAKPKGQVTPIGAAATPAATAETAAGTVFITIEQADNLKQFTSWVDTINGKSILMLQCNPEYDKSDALLVMHLPDGETLLVDCTLCRYRHTPDFPWCAPSLGMSPDEPEPDMSSCFLSQHHR